LLALNFLTFITYVRQLAFYESQLKTEVLQGQLTAYARRVTIIEEYQSQIAEMRHELKNILYTMNIDMEQQNYGRVNQRILGLLGHLKQVEPEHYTGHVLIDAVISYKAERIRELGADLNVQAEMLDADVAAPLPAALAYDIASIMGIALDNVTDAVELLHAADPAAHPPVGCAIQRSKNMLLLDITNPLPAPLRYKNGEIQSTKAESGHGLGLSALRRIAWKYGGDTVITDTGGVFSLSVTLLIQ
jgi:sensor histidine kinase regulating citrate/malate metabolism